MCGLGQIQKVVAVLTTRHTSLKIRGKAFSACVRSAMLHGSETWALNSSDLQRLQQNDRAMVRWICGSKLAEHTPTSSLLHKLGIPEITEVLRFRHLRWYGHVQHATTQINHVTHSAIPGSGRPRKTWSESIKKDIVTCDLVSVSPLDRTAWRAAVRHSLVLPTPERGTPAAP